MRHKLYTSYAFRIPRSPVAFVSIECATASLTTPRYVECALFNTMDVCFGDVWLTPRYPIYSQRSGANIYTIVCGLSFDCLVLASALLVCLLKR